VAGHPTLPRDAKQEERLVSRTINRVNVNNLFFILNLFGLKTV